MNLQQTSQTSQTYPFPTSTTTTSSSIPSTPILYFSQQANEQYRTMMEMEELREKIGKIPNVPSSSNKKINKKKNSQQFYPMSDIGNKAPISSSSFVHFPIHTVSSNYVPEKLIPEKSIHYQTRHNTTSNETISNSDFGSVSVSDFGSVSVSDFGSVSVSDCVSDSNIDFGNVSESYSKKRKVDDSEMLNLEKKKKHELIKTILKQESEITDLLRDKKNNLLKLINSLEELNQIKKKLYESNREKDSLYFVHDESEELKQEIFKMWQKFPSLERAEDSLRQYLMRFEECSTITTEKNFLDKIIQNSCFSSSSCVSNKEIIMFEKTEEDKEEDYNDWLKYLNNEELPDYPSSCSFVQEKCKKNFEITDQKSKERFVEFIRLNISKE